MNRALSVLVLTALSAAALAMPATATSTKTCSSKGLNYKRSDGSATYTVKVTKLRSRGAKCETARKVASDVARRNLKSGVLPSRSLGYAIREMNPCDACSPRTDVRATQNGKRLTFTLVGGA